MWRRAALTLWDIEYPDGERAALYARTSHRHSPQAVAYVPTPIVSGRAVTTTPSTSSVTKPALKDAALSPWRTLRMHLSSSKALAGREQLQVAVEQRRVDPALDHVEHAVAEGDQPVGGGNGVIDAMVGHGLKNR